MKKIVLNSLLLGAFVATPFAAQEPDINIETISFEYGNKRPFSFYYPYNYQYYYPHPQYQRRSSSCYWLYTNGTYVYYCN